MPLIELNRFGLLDRRILPAVTATFSAAHGLLTITGNAHDNTVAVSRNLGGTILVNGHAVTVRSRRATVANTTLIRVFGLGGDDNLSLNEAKGALPNAEILGGDGRDTITGGSGNDLLDGGSGDDILFGEGGADVLNGGDGNDVIDGGQGNDMAFLGTGDDTFVWNPGDGSDALDGQGGVDTLRFNGSDANENINISANGSRLRLSRDVGNVTMDVNGIEDVNVAALGGADTITVNDLTATDVRAVNLNLGTGAGSGDGRADAVIVNGTENNDAIKIQSVANGASITVAGLSPVVNITGAEGANDNLTVNALGGNDVVDASNLPANLIGLTLNGDSGSDTILGSQGNDLITGGADDDVAMLGAGDDTFVWNPGDGSDVVDGEAGADTMVFNGSSTSEQIDVSANGGLVRFARNIGNVAMELSAVETINFNALGGADTINVNDLAGTDLTQLNVDLSAGAAPGIGDGLADTVIVSGTNDADNIQIAGAGSSFTVSGLPVDVAVKGSEGANDHLIVDALGGDDVVSAVGLPADTVQLTVDGGDGNDQILGGDGDDELIGGDGNDFIDGGPGADMVLLGAGDDTFRWDSGDGSDTVEGGEGHDTIRFNGSDASENIEISANGRRIGLTRDVENVAMDLNGIELINLNAQGGADAITVNDLTGTDVAQLNIALQGVASPDSVTVNGTNGDDLVAVTADVRDLSVIGLAAQVNITGADSSNDRLIINSLGGDDVVDASGLTSAAISLAVNGGDGDDELVGGAGNDTLNGDAGNDKLDGDAGNDTLSGGDGDDELIGGPGLDVLDGGPGTNTLNQD